jgi:dTDP-4-amino-4,6-dideoxygalactose transaminase
MPETVAKTSDAPVRTTPFPPLPPRFDGKEAEYLMAALRRNDLFYQQKDGFVARMVDRARQAFGVPYAVATSSGTASLHVAVGAAGVEPGGEVITSPITDMGTCIAILYQNAIPVFADVDEHTYNVTSQSIEAVITDRTRAVIVVHLAGSPCDMAPISELCRRRNLVLIEDCAQALGATYRGRHVGGHGKIGCFSLNNYKHLSTGDGGVVVAHDDATFKLCHNFADKFYDRHGEGVRLSRLAPNYRMSELQGAVGLAQFDRLESIASKRRTLGDRLTQLIDGIPGVLSPRIADGGQSSYWFYMFRTDPSVLGISRDAFSASLVAEGIPAGAGYIARPIQHEPVFLNKAFFASGIWPAEVIAGRAYDYRDVRTPVAQRVLDTAIRLPLHEGWTDREVDDTAAAIRKVALKHKKG